MKAVGAVVATLLLLAGGYVAADVQDAVPGPLTMRRVITDPVPHPRVVALPEPVPAIAVDPDPVPAGDLQPAVDDLAAQTAPLSVTLVDLATGTTVGAIEPATPRVPASSLKLLTAAAEKARHNASSAKRRPFHTPRQARAQAP